MSTNNDLTAALVPVDRALRELGVAYYIGGSIASSYHGAARSTIDVNIVCELRRDHVDAFINLLGNEFYCSSSAILSAIDRQSCFNLIHLDTSFKVDLFIPRGRPFDRQSMQRAKVGLLSTAPDFSAPIATAEDTIIAKLEWYRAAGEISERQWNDVTRLVEILGAQLDLDYLTSTAASVGVDDLLQRLLDSNA